MKTPTSLKLQRVIILTFMTGTLALSPEKPSSDACFDRSGRSYDVGAVVPPDDKCNMCTCTEGGNIVCTQMVCAMVACPRGMVEYQSDGECCASCQPATVCRDENGVTYTAGDHVMSGDPCEICRCLRNGTIGDCVRSECRIFCTGEKVYEEGKCCPVCRTVCEDKTYGTFSVGDIVDTGNPCETCTCENSGDIICAMTDCPRCPGKVVPVEGRCCGDCFVGDIQIIAGRGCIKGEVGYRFGDQMPTDDPCETCFCDESGFMCAMMACMPCPGTQVPVEGSCCGECRDVTKPPLPGCVQDGVQYEIGDAMPTDDPCQRCFCSEGNDRVCSFQKCMPCRGVLVKVEGTCCGNCVENKTLPEKGCELNGNRYDVGQFTDPDDKCRICRCYDDGTVACKQTKCPKLRCKKALVVQPEDQCCPVCQCVYNKQKYMPGPIGDKCGAAECVDGKLAFQFTAPCTRRELMCVDPELDDNCCLSCPQGTTCQIGKRTIRAGEFVKIGNKVCTCLGDPWYPNAFCASKKIDSTLKRTYGKYLASYTLA